MSPDTMRGVLSSDSHSLLLIESDAAGAALVESMLADTHYVIDRVADVDNAVSKAAAGYDVAVLDATGSSIRPIDATRRLLAQCPDLAIVLLCALDADRGQLLEALDAGAEELVCKDDLREDQLRRALDHAVMRRKRVERARQGELAERQAAIGSIVRYVTHEISNQAAVVLASVDAVRARLTQLERQTDVAPLRALLDTQSQAITHLTDVVQQLRALSADGDGEPPVADVCIVLDRVMRTIGNRLSQIATVDIDTTDCVPVALSDVRLAHVVLSLLSHTADSIESANAGHGYVEIRTSRDKEMLAIQITANRAADSATRQSGAGLGLAIASEIVTKVGGSLQRSSHDGDTTLTLRLPIAEAGRPEAESPHSDETGQASSARRSRILFIDDNAKFLEMMERVLQRTHDVVTASSGEEAIAMIADDKGFDTIFCDVMMPKIDGLDVYDYLRNHCSELIPRLVLVSGGVFTDSARQRLEKADVTTISKPCAIDDLIQLIASRRALVDDESPTSES